MERRQPLKRRTPLKSGKPLKQKPLRLSSLDAHAHAAWRHKITRRRCAWCVYEKRKRDLHYVRDPHHVLPARYIRRHVRAMRLSGDQAKRLLRSLLYDPRNGVCLCRVHHDRHERAQTRMPRELIAPQAWAFAGSLGLEWVLDKLYPE